MSSASYSRLPTDDQDHGLRQSQPPLSNEDEEPDLSREHPLRNSTRAEFDRRPPPWWKRFLVLIAIIFFGWLAVRLGGLGQSRQPKVIYANRYSDEFKYRPAASPVITEHLKDGRIRIRGASVAAMGVRPEDIPKTPAQKKREKENRIKEAREAAKAKLGLKSKQRQDKKDAKRRKDP